MSKFLPAGGVLVCAAMAVALGGCGAAAHSAVSASASAASPTAELAADATPAARARPTLHTAKVSVDSRRATIIVTAAGKPVYLLTGDSARHPLCESTGCLAAWPAVSSAHPTASGVAGELAVWRHDGISQVTLDGHPLYTFVGDSGTGSASGEGVTSFGGTWLVLSASGSELTASRAGGASNSSGTGSSGASSSGSGW